MGAWAVVGWIFLIVLILSVLGGGTYLIYKTFVGESELAQNWVYLRGVPVKLKSNISIEGSGLTTSDISENERIVLIKENKFYLLRSGSINEGSESLNLIPVEPLPDNIPELPVFNLTSERTIIFSYPSKPTIRFTIPANVILDLGKTEIETEEDTES